MTISRTRARKRLLRWNRYAGRYPRGVGSAGWRGWAKACDDMRYAITYVRERRSKLEMAQILREAS